MLTIDFEASCLPRDGRSFPIEVGIADPSTGWTRAWLIRPASAWSGWNWTAEAEALHHISRDRLIEEGLPAAAVMAELNAAVGGQRVLADHDFDRDWLETLSVAAGIPSGFRIDHVESFLDCHRPSDGAVAQAMAVASGRVPIRHRAGADALWLATFLAQIAPPAPPMQQAA